jgi:hypothetical protein
MEFRGRRLIRWMVSTSVLFCLAMSPPIVVGQAALGRNGKMVDPIRLADGKAVVLIFVRTDCPISNRYAPEIQHLSTKYRDKAEFWLVYPSRADTFDLIEKQLHEYGYQLPALRDPGHALVKKAQAQITPEAAVFNGRGALIYHGRIDNWYEDFGRARKAATTHELDDALQATTSGRPVDIPAMPAVGCYIADLP